MVNSNALFSDCKKYRWTLNRQISSSCRQLIFIGLNPSFGDAVNNDPTLKRITGFCNSWGYGSLTVINLFGIITKTAKNLSSYDDPVGYKNDYVLNKINECSSLNNGFKYTHLYPNKFNVNVLQ